MYFCLRKCYLWLFVKKYFSYMILLLMALIVTSCRRFTITTDHTIDTKDYTLTVHGQRLRSDAQAASFPVDTFWKLSDTVRLHNDVGSVADNLDNLSNGFFRFGDRHLAKGSYVLSLELVHKPGSNHEANANAALSNLCDWGYITIDTIHWRNVTVVRKGTRDTFNMKNYNIATQPYYVCIPDEILTDSVEGTSLREWIEDWSDARFTPHYELFKFLSKNGYDTILSPKVETRRYPRVRLVYKNFNEF